MRDYVILEAHGDKTWAMVGIVEANDQNNAVRNHLGKAPAGGEFVAIPTRYWRPVTAQVATTTSVNLVRVGSEAKA